MRNSSKKRSHHFQAQNLAPLVNKIVSGFLGLLLLRNSSKKRSPYFQHQNPSTRLNEIISGFLALLLLRNRKKSDRSLQNYFQVSQ
ncbi:MAG: hypothetical protein QNJ64_18765 [Crocosphaera sp.]|nr:hypothetical protein [Crocosphaera sp.]